MSSSQCKFSFITMNSFFNRPPRRSRAVRHGRPHTCTCAASHHVFSLPSPLLLLERAPGSLATVRTTTVRMAAARPLRLAISWRIGPIFLRRSTTGMRSSGEQRQDPCLGRVDLACGAPDLASSAALEKLVGQAGGGCSSWVARVLPSVGPAPRRHAWASAYVGGPYDSTL